LDGGQRTVWRESLFRHVRGGIFVNRGNTGGNLSCENRGTRRDSATCFPFRRNCQQVSRQTRTFLASLREDGLSQARLGPSNLLARRVPILGSQVLILCGAVQHMVKKKSGSGVGGDTRNKKKNQSHLMETDRGPSLWLTSRGKREGKLPGT